MVSSFDIFSIATDYIERRINITELENFNTQMLPFYMSNPDSETAKLSGTIELALAEVTAGIRSERNVRKFLHSNFQQIHNQLYPQHDVMETSTTGTSASFEDLGWQTQPQVVHTEPQVVYA